VTKRIALGIRKLPAAVAKVDLANSLANLSSEGDFGPETLQEVGITPVEALREQSSQETQPYLRFSHRSYDWQEVGTSRTGFRILTDAAHVLG